MAALTYVITTADIGLIGRINKNPTNQHCHHPYDSKHMERADIGVPEIAATSSHYNLYCHRDALDEAKGYLPGPYLLIKQVHLPYVDRDLEQQLVNVACCGGRVWKIIDGAQISTFQKSSPISWQEVNGEEGLLIPS
jgi:hypothetical protein